MVFFSYLCDEIVLLPGYMFTSFALMLPFCASVLGVLIFLFKRYKHVSQQLMLALNVLCLVYFCADTMLIDDNLGSFFAIAFSALRQFVGPVLLPMILLFMRSFSSSKYYSWKTGFWFIFPVMLGSVSVVLFSLMGMDNAMAYIHQCNYDGELSGVFATDTIYQLHYLFGRQVFTAVMLIETIYVIGYLVYVMFHSGYKLPVMGKLLRTGGKVPVVNLLIPVFIGFLVLCAIRMSVGRSFLLNNKALAAVFNLFLSLFILALNYITLYANRSPVSLRTLRSPLSGADSAKKYHYETDNASKAVTPIEGMSAISYAELVDAFKALIMVERIYLETTISVEDVATRLHSNRTYVSCLVSKEYGMNFRDYIGTLRVEHAQKFMKANPEATQEEVAQASGFTSASTFNKKFRQVVGISPRQWQVNN